MTAAAARLTLFNPRTTATPRTHRSVAVVFCKEGPADLGKSLDRLEQKLRHLRNTRIYGSAIGPCIGGMVQVA